MSKQAKTTAAPAAAAMETSPCSLCKDLLLTEIQAIIQTNHGVLTAENKTILEALPLLNTKGFVSVIFNMMTEKQDASIDSRFSPQKVAPIVVITRDGGFKKLVSPVDEKFFDTFKDDGVPPVEWWQHFTGSLMYNDANGKFGCAVCEVEAVPSQNKLSINCPRRGQHGDMKVYPQKTLLYMSTISCSLFHSKLKKSDALRR
jgi:hypothetical protein